MTNSDYLLKATIKKVKEKFNNLLLEKIEEVTTIAQDVPEILKKEIENLKDSIIEEATRMESEENNPEDTNENTYQNQKIIETLGEINDINNQIDKLNKKINKNI